MEAPPRSRRTQGNLDPNTLYHWRVRIGTNSPFFPASAVVTFPYNAVSEVDVRTSGATAAAVTEGSSSPRHVMIEPAAPNPFSGSTRSTLHPWPRPDTGGPRSTTCRDARWRSHGWRPAGGPAHAAVGWT